MAATSELVQEKKAYEVVSGGTMTEAIGGLTAVTLTILSLAGVFPILLASIAVIAIGVALFLKGTTIAAEHKKLIASISNNKLSRDDINAGMSVELITGIGAITLGILSLVGVATYSLLPISTIVLGAGIFMSTNAKSRLNTSKIRLSTDYETSNDVAKEIASSSIDAEIFIGIGVMTLGILAVIGISPMLLTIIGLLCAGSTNVLTGSALGERFMELAG